MDAISVGVTPLFFIGTANMKQPRQTYFSLDLPDDESALAIAKRIAGSGLRTVKVLDDEGNRVVPREPAIRPPNRKTRSVDVKAPRSTSELSGAR